MQQGYRWEIGLRVKGAPWFGMHQDWEWEQLSTMGKSSLVSPWPCWNKGVSVPPALGQGHSHAWCDRVKRALLATAKPRALLRKTQGNEMPGCPGQQLSKRESSPPPQPPEGLCRVGTPGPSRVGMEPGQGQAEPITPGCPSRAEGAADKSSAGRVGLSSKPGLG